MQNNESRLNIEPAFLLEREHKAIRSFEGRGGDPRSLWPSRPNYTRNRWGSGARRLMATCHSPAPRQGRAFIPQPESKNFDLLVYNV